MEEKLGLDLKTLVERLGEEYPGLFVPVGARELLKPGLLIPVGAIIFYL
tara:strand:- start:430 stop:576 length:147 start_codon:yes stop_codon:yes gene_type:complete